MFEMLLQIMIDCFWIHQNSEYICALTPFRSTTGFFEKKGLLNLWKLGLIIRATPHLGQAETTEQRAEIASKLLPVCRPAASGFIAGLATHNFFSVCVTPILKAQKAF